VAVVETMTDASAEDEAKLPPEMLKVVEWPTAPIQKLAEPVMVNVPASEALDLTMSSLSSVIDFV